jgi:EF-P beta-lysylation protein EpmB
MITRPAALSQPAGWQQELAAAIRDPAELVRYLGLDAALLPAAIRAARDFPLLVPLAYARRMRPGDPRDPLLRQVLPLGEELEARPGYIADPVGDLASVRAPGVLSKYAGRTLLIATGACAIHCRYCFRREFPYEDQRAADAGWRHAVDEIRRDPGCREVILSGGDPLVLGERRLSALTAALAGIPQLKRLRLHTRLPVVLPSRVNDALLAWLRDSPLQVVLVLHANHPREIDAGVRRALARLRGNGVTLLNQAVLLRGVNDDTDTLCRLSEALFEAGALPYYLHLLDRVRGTAHFDVSEDRATALVAAAAARLPGYLVPRLVRERAGAPCKTPVTGTTADVTQVAEGSAAAL